MSTGVFTQKVLRLKRLNKALIRAIKRPSKSLLLGNMVSGIVLTTIFCLILIQFSSRFFIVSDFKYLVNL